MTLLPNSLRVRTLLVMFSAVAITQLITYVGIIREHKQFNISSTITIVSRYVQLMKTAIAASPKESHAALLGGLTERTGMRVRQGDAPPAGPVDTSPVVRGIIKDLKSELGPDAIVVVTSREDRRRFLSVGFQAGGEQWWLELDGPATTAWVPLLMIAGTIAAVLALSAFLVCNMTRPLRSLSEAARAFGSGLSKPVVPAGPREIRELADGFNAMVEQIDANERERNVMLVGLPHDLRTPISRLRVRTELLDDEEAREGIRRDVRDIEHIAEQFVQYVRGFDPSSATREPVDLTALVAERVGRWVSSGNDVRLSQPSVGPVIEGDAIALARLVDNLIGNAVQHGSPPIEVEIVRGGTDGVALVVRDHGTGIPYEEQSRVLEPFTKVSTARGTKGSVGLGLAIVTRVARRHGGHVQLRNLGTTGFEVNVTFTTAVVRG
jgi:two-component system osmolarity sensor histidine kinase EnvZ